MNALQSVGINEVREVNLKLCHDIFTNAGVYTSEFIPTGFQIHAGKITIKHHLFI